MKISYYSTNGNAPTATFEEALFRGLAPDGGLYFPQRFPSLKLTQTAGLAGKSLIEVAGSVLSAWFGGEIEAGALAQIAKDAQNFEIPFREVGGRHIMELFHGPTLAFKDVAAQNLPRLMSYFLQKRQEKITLLVATSGDTGGAIAHGFSDVPNIEVFVLFPKGRVSALQEEQLTRVADNVHPIEVDGYFDDCQAMVKQAFNDPDLKHLNLTSANSISIGRLIPQIIYYAYAYAQLGDNLQFIVPSGNFGNLTGGLFAREMGLPFDSFIAAQNENDSAVRYFETGVYDPQETIATLSNAMDVGDPSNFVRVLELFGHDADKMQAVLQAYKVDDKTTVRTIQHVYNAHSYLLDPHTAVGWHVADEYGDKSKTQVLVATASPVKFAGEIKESAGIVVDDSAEIGKLLSKAQRKTAIPNRYPDLLSIINPH